MRKARVKRIELTDEVMDRFFENSSRRNVTDLSAETGLSYTLIYNLVKGRIHTLSAAHYRRLFGEDPPERQILRVNGEYFRGMVRLWLFLHGEETKVDLFKELYARDRLGHRTDYRVFTGRTKTVEGKIERAMERKFQEQGFTRPEIEAWIAELDRLPDIDRIPYGDVKPMLEYLTNFLGVNPSKLLRQYALRYESGGLKTVARPIYDQILHFYQKAKKAEDSGSGYGLERLREEIYGARQGKTLFSEIEQDLEFVKKHAGRGPKRYLGRGTAGYKKGALKRIQTWRAAKIRRDCERVAAANPGLQISELPPWLRAKKIGTLTAVLRTRLLSRMMGPEGESLESGLLKPDYRFLRGLGDKVEKNYVPFEAAAGILGMGKRALDFLVARHGDVFRKIGRYTEGWNVPTEYLEETGRKRGFSLVRMKYEKLAREAQKRRAMKKGQESEPVPSTGKARLHGLQGTGNAHSGPVAEAPPLQLTNYGLRSVDHIDY